MNNITLKSLVLVSTIISVMSFEDLINCNCFKGPAFEPSNITLNVDSPNCVCCHGCLK